MSKIVSIATSVPEHQYTQEEIFHFVSMIHSSDEDEKRKLHFLYKHSGISTRHSVIQDYGCTQEERKFYSTAPDLEPFPSLEKRMICFNEEAFKLSVTAIESCIKDLIDKNAITHLITVSCTGMSAPGLDLQIMEAMDLPQNIFRTSVNFMGCYAAIHALRLADAICNNEPSANVVIVCTELCTLHFQKEKTIDNITATLLFSDGCAAALVKNNACKESGLVLKSFFSNVAFNGKKDMSWKLSSTGFLMTLSGYVPQLVKEDFDALISNALNHAGLKKEAIDHWCMHPGGKKILEAICQSIGLDNEALKFSYQVLNDYGNMSSASILFVLKKVFDDIQQSGKKNKHVMGAAFGPGLTMETFIAVND